MRTLLCALTRLVLGYSGPILVIYHIYLFRRYFSQALREPDSNHTVILNNHGVIKYITEQQDRILDLSLLAAVVMTVVCFVMVILRIRKKN